MFSLKEDFDRENAVPITADDYLSDIFQPDLLEMPDTGPPDDDSVATPDSAQLSRSYRDDREVLIPGLPMFFLEKLNFSIVIKFVHALQVPLSRSSCQCQMPRL